MWGYCAVGRGRQGSGCGQITEPLKGRGREPRTPCGRKVVSGSAPPCPLPMHTQVRPILGFGTGYGVCQPPYSVLGASAAHTPWGLRQALGRLPVAGMCGWKRGFGHPYDLTGDPSPLLCACAKLSPYLVLAEDPGRPGRGLCLHWQGRKWGHRVLRWSLLPLRDPEGNE